MALRDFVTANKEDAEKYVVQGAWQNMLLSDLLGAAAQECPQREALVDNMGRLTYSQLKHKADRLTQGLWDLGIRRGDAVLLQLPNWNEFVYSFFALQKIGRRQSSSSPATGRWRSTISPV